MPTHILIVDDHPLFVEAMQRTISVVLPGAQTREAISIADAKSLLEGSTSFNVVLLDLALPGTKGLDGLLELRTLYPRLPIVVVSAHSDARIVRDVMQYGASGYISKSASRQEIADALKAVMEGMITLPKGYEAPKIDRDATKSDIAIKLQTLTPKQLSVLRMLRQGLLNKQIAHELQIEETTVKAHVSEILRKLGVSSRTQAVIEAQKIDFDAILGSSA